MFIRIITAMAAAGLVALLAWWLYQPASPEIARARALLGERWYALSLDQRHLGYLRTHNYRDNAGRWVFETEQRFAMNPYDPAATTTRRIFERTPPHPLHSAEHLQQRRGLAEGVKIMQTATGYQAVRLPEDGTMSTLDWTYRLADYVAFELWLEEEAPVPGSVRSVMSLDFDRLALIRRSFDVMGGDPSGYLIENAAPFSATRIQLDADYAPVTIEIAGLFDLVLVDRERALAPRSTLQAASYHIPLDRRLEDHTRISQLILSIKGHDRPRTLFPEAEQTEQGWQLTLAHDPVSSTSSGTEHQAETLQLPSAHPDIRKLAGQATAGLTDEPARARALNQFVHSYLNYRPGRPPQSVLTLLEDRVGDCTEFADLLTTLARSIGLPARTVFGLAYADGQAPAFAYHAWNEIYVAGSWMTLDPTWGLDRVDATHIPLPDDEAAAMSLLTGAVALEFAVVDVSHFDD